MSRKPGWSGWWVIFQTRPGFDIITHISANDFWHPRRTPSISPFFPDVYSTGWWMRNKPGNAKSIWMCISLCFIGKLIRETAAWIQLRSRGKLAAKVGLKNRNCSCLTSSFWWLARCAVWKWYCWRVWRRKIWEEKPQLASINWSWALLDHNGNTEWKTKRLS